MSNTPGSKYTEEDGKVKDLDTLLAEEIGEFGKYQAGILVLSAVMAVFAAFSSNEYVFTTARINTRCSIPECDTPNPDFSPWWINEAVPSTSSGVLDECQRYAIVNSSAVVNMAAGSCSPELFSNDVVMRCDEYVYENTNTVVYDFGLACDEWRRSFIGSIRIFGALVGLMITGYISDKWGRRTAFLFNTINTFWLSLTRYWADTYIGFTISHFFEAALGTGSFSAAYIIVMEVVGRRYRVICGTTLASFYSTGQMLLAAIAWAVPYWKDLTLALYVPQCLVVLNIWLATESVRWYMCKGRYSESEALLQKWQQLTEKPYNQIH